MAILGLLFPQQSQAQSLTAHYPMNATSLANDVSGFGNHGTPMAGASLTTDQNGNPNNAYLLNAVGEYIEYSPNSTDFVAPSFPVTIMAWVRNDATGSNKAFLVFTNSFRPDHYDGVWLNINPNNYISGGYGNGGTIGPHSRRTKTGTTPLTTGTWHHVAVVIKGFSDMEIYLDGINDCGTYSGSATNLGTPPTKPNPGSTGKSDMGTSFRYGDGAVNDIRYYDGVLTQSDIWDIAYGNAPYPSDTSNCSCDAFNLNANFTFPGTGVSTVTFTNSSTASVSPSYYIWDFGDGSQQVTFAGTNTVAHTYSSTGTYNVCLTMYYNDGCLNCTDQRCKTVSVSPIRMGQVSHSDLQAKKLGWTLYPNPTSSSTTVDLSGLDGKWEVIVTDLAGRQVASHRVLGQERLLLNTLTSGMYFISLKGNGLVDTKKLLVK